MSRKRCVDRYEPPLLSFHFTLVRLNNVVNSTSKASEWISAKRDLVAQRVTYGLLCVQWFTKVWAWISFSSEIRGNSWKAPLITFHCKTWFFNIKFKCVISNDWKLLRYRFRFPRQSRYLIILLWNNNSHIRKYNKDIWYSSRLQNCWRMCIFDDISTVLNDGHFLRNWTCLGTMTDSRVLTLRAVSSVFVLDTASDLAFLLSVPFRSEPRLAYCSFRRRSATFMSSLAQQPSHR